MTQITAHISRFRQLDTRLWMGLGVAAVGLLAFRELFDYAPYANVRHGSSELEDWFFRPSGGSPILIFGVALCFLYTRWRILADAIASPGPGAAGWLLVAPASLLYVWALYVGAEDLLLLAFITMVLGGGWVLGGIRALRALLLPALFLLLLVPLPSVWINQIIYPMQLATAQATAAVLNAIGFDALASGELIFTREKLFQVIETCAGLRSIDTLVMSAVIYAELFYRSRLQAVALFLIAPFLALLINLGRVLSMVFNPYSDFAAVHTTQGIVMLVIGVLAIAGIDAVLKRLLPEGSDSRWSRMAEAPTEEGASPTVRAVALGGVLASLLLTSLLLVPWEPSPSPLKAPWALPGMIDGWQSQPLKLDKDLLGSVAPAEWTHRLYSRGEDRVELFAASDDLNVRRASILSAKTALPEPGLELRARQGLRLEGVPFDMEGFLFEGPGGRRILVYRAYTGTQPLASEIARNFLGVDRSWLRREYRPAVFRVSTRVASTEAGPREAEQRLGDLLRAIGPFFERVSGPVPPQTAGDFQWERSRPTQLAKASIRSS